MAKFFAVKVGQKKFLDLWYSGQFNRVKATTINKFPNRSLDIPVPPEIEASTKRLREYVQNNIIPFLERTVGQPVTSSNNLLRFMITIKGDNTRQASTRLWEALKQYSQSPVTKDSTTQAQAEKQIRQQRRARERRSANIGGIIRRGTPDQPIPQDVLISLRTGQAGLTTAEARKIAEFTQLSKISKQERRKIAPTLIKQQKKLQQQTQDGGGLNLQRGAGLLLVAVAAFAASKR